MRILRILLGVSLLITILASCRPAGAALPTISDNGNGTGSGLNTLGLNITGPVDESVVRSNPVTVSGNTEAGADVMINGLSVETENGHFSSMVELEPGPNMIDISVKDVSGKQASKYLTVVYVP
jgi:Glucodextranase, domain B